MRQKHISLKRVMEKSTSGWLLRRSSRTKKRVLRVTISAGFSRQFIISFRRFRTSPERRSKQYRQHVIQKNLLGFREFAIALKRKPGAHKRKLHLSSKKPVHSFRLTEQAVLSLVLVVGGLSGSLHFGANLKTAPQLFVAPSGAEAVDRRLSKNSAALASEIKSSSSQKVDFIKPAAEVKPAPEPKPQLPTAMDRSLPSRIRIPKIELNTSLMSTGLSSTGEIAVPDVFDQAVWYDQSPTPGERGPSVITGHVDSPNNIAVFWRLRELAPGDTVQVDRQDGTTASFNITEIRQYSQNEFPTQTVYGNTDYAGIRLITCGGNFDKATGHYTHNTVVYGELM